MEYVKLNDGNQIPAVGFGVFMIPNDGPTYEAVEKPYELIGSKVDGKTAEIAAWAKSCF